MTVPHSPRWPRVVAEALVGVTRPLSTLRAPVRKAMLAELAHAQVIAARPQQSDAPPPDFLLLHQVTPWRRVMAALQGWGGALLVEPVGQGKTWIALAAARAAGEVLVIGPAVLRLQWLDAATRTGVTIRYWSVERLSRGTLPPIDPALVIVDEAHRLRTPATRRVRTVAPFLIGRRVLLVTATPVVNRLEDLVTLLRLCLPEDALRLDGITALSEIGHCTEPPLALRRVVIRSMAVGAGLPAISSRILPGSMSESSRGERAVDIVHRLTARHGTGISRLLAAVFLDAAASSDAALLATLRRYRALLRQARDAGGSDRVTLRRFAGEALDQLVWWELVGMPATTMLLPVEDLPQLEALIEQFTPSDSQWLASLRTVLTDGPPAVCFTRHRATATLLRMTFGAGTAWVMGEAAGIGPHRIPREQVLAVFGPDRDTWNVRRVLPHTLIATDVAAEGLNLQGAGRVVHVDLPWTAMRVAQREGRLRRIGQCHPTVDVVVRHPPAILEDALRRSVAIRRKGSLASRWLEALAWEEPERVSLGPETLWATAPVPPGEREGARVVIRVVDVAKGRVGVLTLHRDAGESWRVVPHFGDSLEPCSSDTTMMEFQRVQVSDIVDSALRFALAQLQLQSGWAPPRLVTRIHRLARSAAWRRDAEALARLDRTLRWCHVAPTLGQRLLVEQLAAGPDDALQRHVAPCVPAREPLTVTAIGVILFRSSGQILRSGDAYLPDYSLRPRRDAD